MRVLPAVVLATSCALAPALSEARQSVDLPYSTDLSWNAVVRLVRVDMGFTITERDREAGFLLFTYRDNTRSSTASIELIPTQVDGIAGVRVVAQIPSMPTYMERHLLTRLDRKLHEEYGEPRRPARPGAGERDREPGRDEEGGSSGREGDGRDREGREGEGRGREGADRGGEGRGREGTDRDRSGDGPNRGR
jgi:hypothetical protein